MSKLNKACKGKSGEEKPELQALLQSLMVTEDETSNEFISVRSRGGLITPCEDIVRILHEAEICFRKEVNKTNIIRNIPVDTICFSTIRLPIVKSLWENMVLTSFSYTKDYVTQYKIKEKQGKKGIEKGLEEKLRSMNIQY